MVRRFNPDKELYKIRYGTRNKVILGVILLLVIVSISSTFALYQVRHTKRIIYTTVSDFSKDINLAVYLDGNKQSDFPSKTENTIYTGIKCDKESVNSSWDYNNWLLILESKLPNKCNVYFETRYKDNSGASYPELYQGMIPITIGTSGELKVADVTTKWYDYDAHEWANAILIDDKTNHNKYYNEDGTYKKDTVIPITDVLQMYVWIPRYRYKLFNAEYGTSDPQMIEIAFESNTTGRSMGTNNGEWYTHPAFLFGNTELNGIWVAKFEVSDATDADGKNLNNIGEITILPNKVSLTMKNIKTMFDASRKIEETGNKYNLNSSEVDTHMIKNMEWGAVAYLTSSKYGRYVNAQKCIEGGCAVWLNNTVRGSSANFLYYGTITGCSGSAETSSPIFSSTACPNNYSWNELGITASTTGNVYGIYDMSGGMVEYVMGNVTDINNSFNKKSSGFITQPEIKYYDVYKYDTDYFSNNRGHLGDATREILVNKVTLTGGWNNDSIRFPVFEEPWFERGSEATDGESVGIFSLYEYTGSEGSNISFRSVLTKEDGNE